MKTFTAIALTGAVFDLGILVVPAMAAPAKPPADAQPLKPIFHKHANAVAADVPARTVPAKPTNEARTADWEKQIGHGKVPAASVPAATSQAQDGTGVGKADLGVFRPK